MSNLEQPPYRTPISDGSLFTGIWQKWLSQLFSNSSASSVVWTPVVTGLTGTATVTGAINRIGGLIYFQSLITPATNTTSVLGTTYLSLPYVASAYGSLTAQKVSSRISLGIGQVDINTSRVYTPAWSAVTEPISINGFVQIVP